MSLQTIVNFLSAHDIRGTITLILAIIGSLGTFYGMFQNRVKFDIRIIECKHSENKILMYLMIQNQSRLPISIGKICVNINGTYYPCVEKPTRVSWSTYHSGKTVTGYANYYNMNMPVSLIGLAGTSGYILFELPKGIDIPDSTHLTFQVSPNRGSAIEKKCPIPQ